MPSTYSPDLRIELIPNGEQSGTWGTTTNNNLGTLIEDAISGAATISVIATNQALTAANGAADEARCAALILTTTTGAPFNIFAPPVTKLYVIYNASSYGATIYCSTVLGNTTAAGAGYDIPAGRTVFIRSNGTVFSGAMTHADTLTLGTQLGVTSGGTGLNTVPALSVPVANSLNTLTALTVAANQSIRLNSAGNAWEAYTPTGGAGSVSSVGLGMPASIFTVSGSPVTTTGTLTATLNSQTANQFFAAPDGSAGTPSFRVISSADLPNIPVTKLNGGSGATASTFWCGNGTWATPTGGAVSSVTGSGAISASPTTGAVVVSVANAGLSTSGIVTTGSQTFGGNKTFDGTITANGLITGGNGFRSTPGSYNFTASNESIFGSSGLVSISVSGSARIDVTSSEFTPDGDNNMGLGSGSKRWTQVYAVSGTINTSDANTKQDIADLDDTEKRVAMRIKGLIKKFRFRDAVAEKGNAARIHVGVIAQEVRDAFTAEGLDATRYGLFCSDTWWEREEDVYQPFNETTVRKIVVHKTPVEGATEVTRLGVRYDELLAFVIAAV